MTLKFQRHKSQLCVNITIYSKTWSKWITNWSKITVIIKQMISFAVLVIDLSCFWSHLVFQRDFPKVTPSNDFFSYKEGRRVSVPRSLEFGVWSFEFGVFFFFFHYLAYIGHYEHANTRSSLNLLCGMHVWNLTWIGPTLQPTCYELMIHLQSVNRLLNHTCISATMVDFRWICFLEKNCVF